MCWGRGHRFRDGWFPNKGGKLRRFCWVSGRKSQYCGGICAVLWHALPGCKPDAGFVCHRNPFAGSTSSCKWVPRFGLRLGSFWDTLCLKTPHRGPGQQAGRDIGSQQKLTGPLRRGSVKKNMAAIHVSGKLTLLQRKLSNVLLLNAYDTLISQPKHQIDARTLCLMIGYNSNDTDTLRDALRGLAETVAEWDMLDDKGKQEWGVSSLLSYARLKGGVCEYAYSPALAEKLHDPKVFALINLNIQRRFTSGHGLALDENCYRFVRTGSTGWWPIDTFRRLMGVDDSVYYRSFKHLNAKIIKPAVAEVNRTSNIEMTPE